MMIRREALKALGHVAAGSSILILQASASQDESSFAPLIRQLQECRRHCQVSADRLRLRRDHGAVTFIEETARLCEVGVRLCERSDGVAQSPAIWQACSDACLRVAGISRSSAMDADVFIRTAEFCQQMVRL